MVAGAGATALAESASGSDTIRGRFHVAGGAILTLSCEGLAMRRAFMPLIMLLPVLGLLPAACGSSERERAAARARDSALIATDPVIARALHDPLMTDPDLASRNEANAMLGQADSSALPVLRASPALTSAASNAMRLALLEGGAIPHLPSAQSAPRGPLLGPAAGGAALLKALGAPEACGARLREDFMLAADLPPVAAILPRGMVVQAGGADAAPCRIRIIRYVTPATIEDVLIFHHTLAVRAGMTATRHARPEDLIAATAASGERLVVHTRPAAHGMTGVDLLYMAPAKAR